MSIREQFAATQAKSLPGSTDTKTSRWGTAPSPLTCLGLAVLVAVVYALVLATGDIQEDAFITFRTAFNFADFGELSFNLGEGQSGATSFLYPLGIALVRLLAGANAIGLVLLINACAVVASGYLLAGVLLRALGLPLAMRRVLWVLLALAPVSLLMAVRGMEAPYVVLLFARGLQGLQLAPGRWGSLWPVVLLPFIRPDAIAFSLILAGAAFLMAPRLGVRYGVAAMAGAAALAIGNRLMLGSCLPASILAKSLGTFESRSLLTMVKSEAVVFFHSPLFLPAYTKYLLGVIPLFTVLALLLAGTWVWRSVRRDRTQRTIQAGMWAGIVLVPAAYAFGGVVFPWYVWPSQMLYQTALIASVLCLAMGATAAWLRRGVLSILLVGVLASAGLQWALSCNTGVQEGVYRASVGRFIASIAAPGDTLYLEPAGYIPFYSGLRTIDEVGLVSPVVLKYKRADPEHWWIECLRQERPTFLVQRAQILDHKTYQGYQMTSAEAAWFDATYEMVRVFHYQPEHLVTNPFLRRLLRYGSHDDYYVLKRRPLTLSNHNPNLAPHLFRLRICGDNQTQNLLS